MSVDSVTASAVCDPALGMRVREMRKSRNMSQEDLAGLLSVTQPVVHHIEKGDYRLTAKMRKAVMNMLSLAAEDGHLAWFMPWLEAEQAASSLKSWEGTVIPGLFQTAGYARHVLAAADPGIRDAEVERQVAARMKRQEIWQRDDPPPPVMSVVIGEMALRQQVGPPLVMREQLHHLARMSAHPCVRIRVLPFRAGNSVGLLPAFVLAGFAPDPRPDIAYLDDALVGRTSDKRAVVAKLGLVWDRLAAEALSPGESASIIRKAAGEWTA